jgi:2,4-dienoyl-CoA reductase-like NADH-dependent reductase (Old Yellow Enzyme family)
MIGAGLSWRIPGGLLDPELLGLLTGWRKNRNNHGLYRRLNTEMSDHRHVIENAFTPCRLGGLELRNRLIRAGCFEGMCQGGQVTDALIDHHRALAAGGIGMTTVAYCSVSHDGRAFDHELWMRREVLPDLERLTCAVHAEGAAASIQLGHSGFFTNKAVIGKRPLGASPAWCLFMRSRCRAMTAEDIADKIRDFSNAAMMARDAGFDAVELHAGHGYLLSQFLSPWTNKRRDDYGGSLSNRIRFARQVIELTREKTGPDFPILVKMNLEDGMPQGIGIEDSVHIAQAFEKAGASALVPSSGFTARVPFLMLRGNLPVLEMSRNQPGWADRIGMRLFGRFLVPEHPYRPLFQFEQAKRIHRAVGIPVIYVGGVDSNKAIGQALQNGFEFVQLGRATIQDPGFASKIERGEMTKSPCDHCNRCVAAMDAGGVYCVSNRLGFMHAVQD